LVVFVFQFLLFQPLLKHREYAAFIADLALARDSAG
jgi:hypothetical protein